MPLETLPAALSGIFASSFVVGLSGALMPGPVLTVTVSEVTRRGFVAGPLLIAGHAVLEALLIALLLAGLGPFLRQDVVVGVVGVAGAGIMLWMAAGSLLALPRLRLQVSAGGGAAAASAAARGGRSPAAAGFLISLSNPYWILWWATVGITYLNLSLRFGAVGLAAFFGGHLLADLSWYSLVALGVSRGRRFLSDRSYRWLVGACSLLLIALAFWFGARGLGRLLG